MDLDPNAAAEIARRHFNFDRPLVRLGWGVSGFVYLSPDKRTAVKIHRQEESFTREVDAYQKLQSLRLWRLHGLTIPRLHAHRADAKLIEMDLVRPPYLLDFAGVRFTPPDFSEDVMEQWHAGIAEQFGQNAYFAYLVHHSLAKHGIYYLDFRPSNLNLKGLPEAESTESLDEDVES